LANASNGMPLETKIAEELWHSKRRLKLANPKKNVVRLSLEVEVNVTQKNLATETLQESFESLLRILQYGLNAHKNQFDYMSFVEVTVENRELEEHKRSN